MPLPLFFIGVAATTGSFGALKTLRAGKNIFDATKLNKDSTALVNHAAEVCNQQRELSGKALSVLGEEKIFVLNNSVNQFLDTFSKLKNVDFRSSEGLEELKELHIDSFEFNDLKEMAKIAGGFAGSALVGTTSGALVAFGAYGAAQTLACASTGTAIASLSGAAATNATLAFFGGGAVAYGGLGMAGGSMVLGGLVAGPALLVMGSIMDKSAKKNLNKALCNREEAVQVYENLSASTLECEAIRRRSYMFYNLLARLDSYFLPLIYKMEDIYKLEGDDYSQYSVESKKVVASCASVAVSIKSVLDTPLLTEGGALTEESLDVVNKVSEKMDGIAD